MGSLFRSEAVKLLKINLLRHEDENIIATTKYVAFLQHTFAGFKTIVARFHVAIMKLIIEYLDVYVFRLAIYDKFVVFVDFWHVDGNATGVKWIRNFRIGCL